MRTTELRDFYHILSDLNNSFTHYSLVWSQFDSDYKIFFKNAPKTLTKDYFSENPFRNKHNIKFDLLEKEHKKTNQTLINGIFLLIYSNFESYLKNILQFAIKVDSKINVLEDKIQTGDDDYMLLDKICNRVGIDKNNLPLEELVALDYIRLKRNRMIHSNAENVSKSLNNILKTYGENLNTYWGSVLPSGLQGVNFLEKENANEINFSIIIDHINIFRKISANIDKLIVVKLTNEEIIANVIIPDFKKIQSTKLKSIKFDRLYSKFQKYCQSEYSLIIKNEFFEKLKRDIA